MNSDWSDEYKGRIASSLIPDGYIIRYTTSDNTKIEKSYDSANYFGANILAHNYTDGEGTIVFADKPTEIGNSAFSGCSSITSIYCKAQTPPSIDSSSFSYWSRCSFYVPTGCKEAYAAADYWKNAKETIEMEF